MTSVTREPTFQERLREAINREIEVEIEKRLRVRLQAEVAAEAERVMNDFAGPVDRDRLTRRELSIVRVLANGWTSKEIAQNFGISDKTVRNHCANIYQKLGVSNRGEAVALAFRRGWLK